MNVVEPALERTLQLAAYYQHMTRRVQTDCLRKNLFFSIAYKLFLVNKHFGFSDITSSSSSYLGLQPVMGFSLLNNTPPCLSLIHI